MPSPTLSISLFASSVEDTDYKFYPRVEQSDDGKYQWLTIEDICIFATNKQLEILKSTIAVYLEAQKEKNQAVAHAIVEEAISETPDEPSYPVEQPSVRCNDCGRNFMTATHMDAHVCDRSLVVF